ncbi:MAG: FISUMP domain-containing protein [Candidatus Odinarchaeota archaeon]
MTIIVCSTTKSQTITDYDGNVYSIVTIGDQTWMAENLKTTHYSDGTLIEYSLGFDDLSDDSTKRYFYYDDDSTYVENYGFLYNWYAAVRGIRGSTTNPSNIQGVCPSGWHVPSKAEWTELISYVGENSVELLLPGGWTGFDALLGGVGGDYNFDGMNEKGYYIMTDPGNNYDISIFCNILVVLFDITQSEVFYANHLKEAGYSVRCVKDSTATSRTRIIPNKSKITFYPNPCQKMITVESEMYNNLIVNIYSLDGKLVLNNQLSSYEKTVMLKNLNEGLYIIILQSEKEIIKIDKLLIH